MPTAAPLGGKPSKEIFDPFNSSATGHQRAENRLSGSTSWRDSRALKLQNQFKGGFGGGKRVSDTVSAGSPDFGQDGRTANGGWVKGAKGLRVGGQQSIWESMKGIKVEKEIERQAKKIKTEDSIRQPTAVTNPYTPFVKQDGSIRETSWRSHESSPSHLLSPIDPNSSFESPSETEKPENSAASPEDKQPPQMFANLTIYINGSTAPIVSDHKLKHLLSSHGARMSIALGRRTVTHVIIGRPSSNGGSGGGLSGTKIQKEIAKSRGIGIKFITAEWVLESVRAGIRLPESKFAALNFAPKGVASASTTFAKPQKTAGAAVMDQDDGG